MTLKGARTAETTTNVNGYYTFLNLPAGGSYTVTPISGKIEFTPRSHFLNNLGKDESADFSGLIQSDLPAECSDTDKDRERKAIIERFGTVWRRGVEAEQEKLTSGNAPYGVPNAGASLGPVKYQTTFLRNCTAAVVTARYFWEVTGPAGPTRVPKEKRFACAKLGGIWLCN